MDIHIWKKTIKELTINYYIHSGPFSPGRGCKQLEHLINTILLDDQSISVTPFLICIFPQVPQTVVSVIRPAYVMYEFVPDIVVLIIVLWSVMTG